MHLPQTGLEKVLHSSRVLLVQFLLWQRFFVTFLHTAAVDVTGLV